MKFSVTLIHGTYAMGAAWTKPESKLCKYLKTQFGEDVEFDRFEWRAPNRHGARFEASRKLLDEHKTKKCLFRETGIPQFVIAHSHGGSVLAYALRDDADFAKALAGAAFLSTPFIQARERPTGLSLLKRLPFVIAFLAFLIAFFLSLIAYAELGYSGRLTTAAVWIWILFLGCVTLLSFFGARAWIDLPETGLPVKLEPAVQQILSELSLSGLSEEQLSEKTLILRANADEASSSLAAVHIVTRLLNEIPARIGRIPSTSFGFLMNKWDAKLRMQEKNPTRPFRVVVGCVFVGLMFKFFGIPLIRRLSGVENFEANWPLLSRIDSVSTVILFHWLYMGTLWSVIALTFLSVSLALLAMPMIAVLFRVAYGRWLLLSALFVELSVETMPPGEWCVNQLDLNDPLAPDALTHSMSYDDERAHKIIANWIRERLDAELAPGKNKENFEGNNANYQLIDIDEARTEGIMPIPAP